MTNFFVCLNLVFIENEFHFHLKHMTIKKFGIDEMGKQENIGVWFCEHCEQFHLKAGNVLLSFDRQEFSEFVGSAWDCYYGQEFNLAAIN